MSNEESQPSNADVLEQYGDYLMPIWKHLNVPVRRAEGCVLEDFDGNEYLDMFAGISVANVGHGNDAVVEAAIAQLESFVHGSSYVHPHRPVAELAATLAEITPGDLKRSFFCNSGTEAVEGAVKLARKYTGSTEIISLEMGFHGRTLGSLALTGNSRYKHGQAPTLNDVFHAPAPYGYRCPTCDGDTCSADCAAAIEHVIQTHTSEDVAAIVVEPVLGEGGIIVPPDGWFARVREIADEYDALLIADEVQTGYGRTGEWWACDHFDATPDIVTQAKALANGLPLGAFTAREEVGMAFESGDHNSTFGGNPVSCAAALATIDELQNGVVADARAQGSWLDERLARLEADYDVVGDVRGLGLMRGIELVDRSEMGPRGVAPAPDADLTTRVADTLRGEGVVIGTGGFYRNVLRFQPPLTVTRGQLREALEQVESALDAEA